MTDYELLDKYVDMIMLEGKEKYPGSDGYPYALGYLQGKLSNIITRLKYNPDPVDLYLEIINDLKERLENGTS